MKTYYNIYLNGLVLDTQWFENMDDVLDWIYNYGGVSIEYEIKTIIVKS